MNKVCIVGRMCNDPELRQTQNGIASCRFTVAVNHKFKNEHTGEFEADFISCVAWRQTAEFVSRYFNKGKMIALEGTLRTGNYTDKNYSDVTHYTTDVFVENVEFVGGKNDSNKSEAQPAEPVQNVKITPGQKLAPAKEEIPDGDLDAYYEILNGDDMPF